MHSSVLHNENIFYFVFFLTKIIMTIFIFKYKLMKKTLAWLTFSFIIKIKKHFFSLCYSLNQINAKKIEQRQKKSVKYICEL